MKPREYCCCAIPLVNAGIYATLAEQFVLGIIVGSLSVATPSIVGAVTPTMAPWILGIVAFIAAGFQILGFIGVVKEKTITYRRYLTLHILATLTGFILALVWIILSATGHSTAQSRCETTFFASPDSVTSAEGQILCNIFPWVDVGIMGGLWVFFACVQFYFYLILSSWGSAQRRDHANFGSEYAPINSLTNDIPLTHRNEAWDSDTDKSKDRLQSYGHARQESAASASSVTDYRYHQRQASFGKLGYGGYDPYPPVGQPLQGNAYPHQPVTAHTQDPGPTPRFSESYYTGDSVAATPNMDKPERSQVHPAEGSFHRKTPRVGQLIG